MNPGPPAWQAGVLVQARRPPQPVIHCLAGSRLIMIAASRVSSEHDANIIWFVILR